MTAFGIVGAVLVFAFFAWVVVQMFGHRLPPAPKHDRYAEDKVKRPSGMGW
jgi:O-antigen ligase